MLYIYRAYIEVQLSIL